MNYTENINAKIKYLQNLSEVIKDIEDLKSRYLRPSVKVTDENVEQLAKIAKNIRYNKFDDVYEYRWTWESDERFRLFDDFNMWLDIEVSETDAAGYLDEDKREQLKIINDVLATLTAKIK